MDAPDDSSPSRSVRTDTPSNSHTRSPPFSGSGLPMYQHRVSLRPHPYLRMLPARNQDRDATDMPIFVPLSSYDETNRPYSHHRRRFPVRSPVMCAQVSPFPHFSGTAFAAYSHTALPQHVWQELERERQRQRLICLFLIPEFFKAVREGWGAAVREERQKNLVLASKEHVGEGIMRERSDKTPANTDE